MKQLSGWDGVCLIVFLLIFLYNISSLACYSIENLVVFPYGAFSEIL